MEHSMAQGAGLSIRQKQFLAVVLEEKYLLTNFYLSGGTALSSWYLHHRESYDLDFFTTIPFDKNRLVHWMKTIREKIGARAITLDEDFGFLTFFIRYQDNDRLKIDFNHYTTIRLKKALIWKGLEIDSLFDIAVNKTHTIRTNPRERDYIDLYFILRKTHWQIKTLLIQADKKFGITTDELQIAKNLLKVFELTDLPKILIPFNQKEMEKFYLHLATSLKTQIFKK